PSKQARRSVIIATGQQESAGLAIAGPADIVGRQRLSPQTRERPRIQGVNIQFFGLAADRLAKRVEPAGRRLPLVPVDEVEVHNANPGLANALDGPRYVRYPLRTAQAPQDVRLKTLNSQAETIDAVTAKESHLC